METLLYPRYHYPNNQLYEYFAGSKDFCRVSGLTLKVGTFRDEVDTRREGVVSYVG